MSKRADHEEDEGEKKKMKANRVFLFLERVRLLFILASGIGKGGKKKDLPLPWIELDFHHFELLMSV